MRAGVVIEVTSDLSGLERRFSGPRLQMAQNAFGRRVLADSDFYAMERTGALRRSGFMATSGEEITWSVPYANDAYNWPGKARTERNPNATTRWFETAKRNRLGEWQKFVAGLMQ